MRLLQLNKQSKSEIELVNGCKQNERKMQKCLFDRYKNAMYTAALRITGNSDIAHDALQEAFIDVFESIGDFRFESSLGTWIKTIVIRKSLRKLKSERHFEPIEEADKLEVEDRDLEFTAEELEKAIHSLPDSAKTIFLLIEVEGYKHQEAAEILGISVGTTKSQLNYSKKLLRKRLYEKIR